MNQDSNSLPETAGTVLFRVKGSRSIMSSEAVDPFHFPAQSVPREGVKIRPGNSPFLSFFDDPADLFANFANISGI